MLGYAVCGSFCCFEKSLRALESLLADGHEIQPIISERAWSTSTRFFSAEEFRARVQALTGREAIHTVEDAEPLGPRIPLDALIIAPCTGNTLAKLSLGITDSAVTMAAKAHLRSDRPLLIALASNDAMSQNLSNLGRLITHRSVYFVPLVQDDPENKPHSLVAKIEKIPECIRLMEDSRQARPLFLENR
jgi:dipicolinate synthase subunit B